MVIMNAIKIIELKNFQCHKHLKCTLSNEVTTFIGPSDEGKSAILRALRWVAMNDPAGDSFIRWGAKFAKVKLTLDDDTIITRKRGVGQNLYKLNDEKYVSFKNSVPPDIQKTLRIIAENFQQQYDNPFWISETAGELARQLNKIVNLDIIDYTMSELNSRARKVNIELEIIQEKLDGARIKQERCEISKEINKQLTIVEKLDFELENVVVDVEELEPLINKIDNTRVIIKSFGRMIRAADQVIKVGDEYSECAADCDHISTLMLQIHHVEEYLKKEIPDLSELENLFDKHVNMASDKHELNTLVSRIEHSILSVSTIESLLYDAEKSLEKEMVGKCPLCENPIKS